jgi:hypothetical protein
LWWVPERALRSWGVRWGCDLLTRSDLLELGAVGPMLESMGPTSSQHYCRSLIMRVMSCGRGQGQSRQPKPPHSSLSPYEPF